MQRLELGELFFDVSLALWCCALVYLTQRGLCSAYVPMLMVAFPLATKLLLAREFKHRGTLRKNARNTLVLLFLFLSLTFLFCQAGA